MRPKTPPTYLSVHPGLNRTQKRRALRTILHQMKTPPTPPKAHRPTRAERRARAKKQIEVADAGPATSGD